MLKSKDLLGIKELTSEEIYHILDTASSFKDVLKRDIKKVPPLRGKSVVSLFFEPSTRTKTSFALAAKRLSADFVNFSVATSSVLKGESIQDTALTIQALGADFVVVRHASSGVPHILSKIVDMSVINAGDGANEHPTQALLDIYTLFRCFTESDDTRMERRYLRNAFSGKTIAFVGDLKRGRTVRSLTYLLCRYSGVRLLFVSPPELRLGEDIMEYLDRSGMEFETTDDLRRHLGDCDAVYMTRLQDEHDEHGESRAIDYDKFNLTTELAKYFKPNLVIMHPLPRRRELDQQLDSLPQAKYWEQVRNGMWMRASLIASIFNFDVAVRDHYHAYYAL